MQANKHYMWRINPEIAILKFIKGNVAISVSDKFGKTVYANDRFCRITGCNENELLGAVNCLFNQDNHKDPCCENLWETIERGQVWKGTLKNKTKTGDSFWLETTIVPLVDVEGNIESFVTMYLNVSKPNQDITKEELNNMRKQY
ncbi:PAS domain-containing protein [Hwangdonia seohaensis]|uniref:PAS domain-containing protein n=1 Tax=Hwangdonia seohaensis TaxID=1240727 RepID=A0ABW3R7I9_9FLAO|nr:PAS domain-containing protein [Hwangdonia seohaensis]